MNIDEKTQANLTSEQVLEIVKQEEQIHRPPPWIWKLVIGFSLAGFSLFSLFIIGHENKGLIKNDTLAVSICALTALSFTIFSLYKLSTRGFSIRLNHFGMMVTNYSKQKWYPWNDVNEIYTGIYHSRTITHLYVVIEVNTDEIINTNDCKKNSEKIVIPENYEVSAHALVKEMLYFKNEYENMNLKNMPELVNEAKKDPPQILNIIWGRLGAKRKP